MFIFPIYNIERQLCRPIKPYFMQFHQALW